MANLSATRVNGNLDVIKDLRVRGELYSEENKVYHEGNKPTKTDVGLSNVQNVPAVPIAGGIMTGDLKFGPNSQGKYLNIGTGNTTGVSGQGSIYVSNGNLHIDPAPSNGIYLGYYQGSGITYFSNGDSDTGTRVESGEYYAHNNRVYHAGNNPTKADIGFGVRSNWVENGMNDYVSGQLTWRAHNNGHTIFDSSNSTSPTGSSISDTNPAVSWSTGYPTLMGWNGNSSYGVRVDVARYAEQSKGTFASGGNITEAGQRVYSPNNIPNPDTLNSLTKYLGSTTDFNPYLLDPKGVGIHNNWSASSGNSPSGAYNYGTTFNFGTAGNSKCQLYCSHTSSSSDSLWFRSGYGTSSEPWARIYSTNYKPTSTDVGLSNVPNTVHTTAATANTVVVRDASADVTCRLVRSNYQNESTLSGGIVFRKSTTDNYLRICNNPASVKSWIGLGNVSNVAALALTGGTLTGTLTGRRGIFTGTGNDFATGAIELNGNGSSVYPTLGFHQPNAYAGSIQQKNATEFHFMGQGGVTHAGINVDKITNYGTLTNNGVSTFVGQINANGGINSGSITTSGGIRKTSGNFHIDGSGTSGTYINWTSGSGGVYFGNGAQTSVANFNSSGVLSCNGISCSGDITTSSIYASNWLRARGQTGLFFQDYGGGWNMSDTTWIRNYGSKSLYMNNQIACTSNVTAYYSDKRLKDVIEELDGKKALESVCSWKKVKYTANELAKELADYDTEKVEIGLLAQEIEKDYPELTPLAPFDYETLENGEIVSKSGENYKTLNYERVVSVQAAAITELNNKIDKQDEKLYNLETEIENLKCMILELVKA